MCFDINAKGHQALALTKTAVLDVIGMGMHWHNLVKFGVLRVVVREASLGHRLHINIYKIMLDCGNMSLLASHPALKGKSNIASGSKGKFTHMLYNYGWG